MSRPYDFGVFRSRGLYLTARPSFFHKGGQWDKKLERALRFPVYFDPRDDRKSQYTLGWSFGEGELEVWSIIRRFRKKFTPSYWPEFVIYRMAPEQVEVLNFEDAREF